MIDYQRCLLMFMPGTQWSIVKDYDSLIFHDNNPKPSLKLFEEWQSQINKQDSETEYQRLRETEYPSIKDCVEALLEFVLEDRKEKSLVIQKLRNQIKEKYPKP